MKLKRSWIVIVLTAAAACAALAFQNSAQYEVRFEKASFKGGEPRVVLRADGLDSNGGSLAWTSDGNRLLYPAKGRIWTVSASVGEHEAMSTGINGFRLQPALSPDGSTIAFNAASGGQQELGLMEDFVCMVKRGRIRIGDRRSFPRFLKFRYRLCCNAQRKDARAQRFAFLRLCTPGV